MRASRYFIFGFALSVLATTAYAIDDPSAAVNHVERAATQIEIDASIKSELRRILWESLPAYLAKRAIHVTPSDDCARATGGVNIVLAKRVPGPSCPRLRDSVF